MAKEFKRNVCFMFFESYLKSADKIEEQFGTEIAYEYLTGIVRYALYQEKPYNEMIEAMIAPLFGSIDAKQKKRELGFYREHADMEEVIARYNEKYPEIYKI